MGGGGANMEGEIEHRRVERVGEIETGLHIAGLQMAGLHMVHGGVTHGKSEH